MTGTHLLRWRVPLTVSTFDQWRFGMSITRKAVMPLSPLSRSEAA
jgi:hypothetical protein